MPDCLGDNERRSSTIWQHRLATAGPCKLAATGARYLAAACAGLVAAAGPCDMATTRPRRRFAFLSERNITRAGHRRKSSSVGLLPTGTADLHSPAPDFGRCRDEKPIRLSAECRVF